MENLKEIEQRINCLDLYGLENMKCGDALHYKLAEDYMYSLMKLWFIRVVGRVLRASFTLGINIKGENRASAVFVCSNSYRGRKDYLRWIKAIAGRIDSAVVIAYGRRRIYLKNFKYIPLFFRWHTQLRRVLDLKRSLIYTSLLFEAYVDYRFIKSKISSDAKILATLSDAHTIDSMLVQCFRDKIDTATFQHGIFENYSSEYTYSKSKYFLISNEYSKRQALEAGLEESGLMVLGMPQLIGVKLRDRLYDKESNVISIFLTGDNRYLDDDKEMIELTKSLISLKDAGDYRLFVKFHPDFGKEKYSTIDWDRVDGFYDTKTSAKEVAKNSFLCIVAGSSVFVELSIQLYPVVSYKGKNPRYKNIECCTFDSAKSLKSWVMMLKNEKKEFEKNEKKNRELFSCKGNITANYADFFNGYIR